MPKLSKRFVDTVKSAGFHGDGEGLYLSVKPSGSKSWVLRTMVRGKRRDIGLGSASSVSLAEARERARHTRKVAREGGDPLAKRDAPSLTFSEAAAEYHSVISPTFTSEKHARLWLSGLRIHAFPSIGQLEVGEVSVTDVRKVLEPIWTTKHETARKLKQRMEAIFDWAKAEGHYERENPCAGVKRVLKPQRRTPKHHAALAWEDLPAFYKSLEVRECMTARALQFIILTACRSKEVRHATWDEIGSGTWSVPGERTKTRKLHRVPLPDEALRVLDAVRGYGKCFIFPSHIIRGGKLEAPLSVNAFRALYKRMNQDGLTVHGFRSTFRDWCAESEKTEREVAEAALAHSVGQVERAYRRTDLYERRVPLMGAWGAFVSSAL